MPEKNHQNWLELLKYPEISPQISSEDVYRAACIGAVMLLFEAGDCDGLMEAVRNASAEELAQAPAMNRRAAEQVWQYFHGESSS